MAILVMNDEDLRLVAVEYPDQGASQTGGQTSGASRRGHVNSQIAALFEFTASPSWPQFCEDAEDGDATLTHIVTSDRGEICAYAWSERFRDPLTGKSCAAGRYLVRLVTSGVAECDDEGVVTIPYRVEPLRSAGALVALPRDEDYALQPRSAMLTATATHAPVRWLM